MRVKILVALIGTLLCSQSVWALDIIKAGKPVATVVTPENPDEVVKEASKILCDHIKLATGATLAVLPESKAAQAKPAIHVGWTAAAKQAGLAPEKLVADGYFMRVRNGVLHLCGRDVIGKDFKIAGSLGAKGTLVAAIHFLRDFANVRWLMPGPHGSWTPTTSNLIAPDDLDRLYVPPLTYAMVRLDRYYPWSLANGARVPINIYSAGGHTWVHGVPPSKYAKEHPEYYAEIKGKRAANPEDTNPMLCTSNPNFVPLMTAWIQSKFDEGYDIVQLGQSDGFKPCECSECTRLFGDPKTTAGQGRRVLLPHLEIARRCLKSHPDKYVMLLVYSGPGQYVSLRTRDDERKVTDPDVQLPFPPNVLAEVTDMDTDVLERYAKAFKRITTYNYWWSPYHGGLAPKQTPASIAERMRHLVKLRTLGTYFCGGGENWPAEGPTYYVGLAAVQRPEVPPEKLMEEFCKGLYGKAASTMLEYYTELYRNITTKPDDGTPTVGWLFQKAPRDHQLGEKYLSFWPAESLNRMETLLKKARAEAGEDVRARNWIRLAQIGFDHIRLTAAVYRAHRAYEAGKSIERLKEIKQALDARKAFVEEIKKLPGTDGVFTRDYFPNHGTFIKFLDDECRSTPMGVPFSWDVDKALAEGKLP